MGILVVKVKGIQHAHYVNIRFTSSSSWTVSIFANVQYRSLKLLIP